MTSEASTSVLRQMTKPLVAAMPDVPLTASRAVRLAVTRAAEQAIGLTLSVRSVAEDIMPLDDLMSALNDDLLMVGLMRGDDVIGLMVVDFQFATCAGEAQTLGKVNDRAPDQRRLTGTDLSLTEPVMSRLLQELEVTTERTVLDGWSRHANLGERITQVRRIPFDLPDVDYRVVRISLDLGVEGRDSEMIMALPATTGAARMDAPVAVADWSAQFRAAVLAAPATLDAVLHRFRLPLSVASDLEVGQTLPLPGCNVGSVRLVSPDGQTVARARLGQIAGQIAVRVEPDDDTPLLEMSQPGSRNPPPDQHTATLGTHSTDGLAMTDHADAGDLSDLDGDAPDDLMSGMSAPVAMNPDLAMADDD